MVVGLLHAHPYYPRYIDLPGWQPPAINFDKILGWFFAAVAVVLLASYIIAGERTSDVRRKLWALRSLQAGY